jgi:hypothetical protein
MAFPARASGKPAEQAVRFAHLYNLTTPREHAVLEAPLFYLS